MKCQGCEGRGEVEVDVPVGPNREHTTKSEKCGVCGGDGEVLVGVLDVAKRIEGLVVNHKPEDDEELRELIVDNLGPPAKVHRVYLPDVRVDTDDGYLFASIEGGLSISLYMRSSIEKSQAIREEEGL